MHVMFLYSYEEDINWHHYVIIALNYNFLKSFIPCLSLRIHCKGREAAVSASGYCLKQQSYYFSSLGKQILAGLKRYQIA